MTGKTARVHKTRTLLTHSRLHRSVDENRIDKKDSNFSAVIGIAPSTPPNHLSTLSLYLPHIEKER
jgi:hypothetical protein